VILFVCLVATAYLADPPRPEKVPYRIVVDGQEYLCRGHDIVDLDTVVLHECLLSNGELVTVEMEFEILEIGGGQ